MEPSKLFGLLGKNISYSFSKKHFTEKFLKENRIEYRYENFDMNTIDEFPIVLQNNTNIKGLNVTIPYKESIIPYLQKLSKKAKKIGAVNVIRFTSNGKLKGYNSDYYGFKKSIEPLLKSHHKKALILGTGGASKAIKYALKELEIPYTVVSRNGNEKQLSYDQLTANTIETHQILINCSPLGTSPNTEAFPLIPYQYITSKHLAYDLIYNPEETVFLSKAKAQGAITKNGHEMLLLQAQKAWEIWNK